MVNKFPGSSIWNSPSKIPQSKFYKFIVFLDELWRFMIPEEFASRYCKNMLNPVYLQVPGGKVWEVEVEHSQSQIWLAKGLKNFSDYYSIECGHFLMFEYNAPSHFNVIIFDVDAAEIEYPTAESDSESDDSNVLERKRKRQEGDAEDDNVQTNVIKEEESQGNVVSLDQKEEADSESEEDDPKKSSRHSLVNLKAKDPYYRIVVKETQDSNGIIDMKKIRLVNEKEKEWEVEIVDTGRGVIIKGGWVEFRTHNKIAKGETLRFKLIRGHAAANVLKVQKIPTPHSLQ